MRNQTKGMLSTFSRPDQVGWWFRVGRRDFGRIPPITSLHTYEKLWIGWWSSLQPDWREGGWPLLRGSVDGPWDELLVGGKDGLFVVMMTLSWWIMERAKDESGDSELEKAIADVLWVLFNLVSTLLVGDSEQPSPSSSAQPLKVGPPRKRARLDKS